MKFVIENSFETSFLKDFDEDMKIKVFKELRLKLLNYINNIIRRNCPCCCNDYPSYISISFLDLRFDIDYFILYDSMLGIKRILEYADDHEEEIATIHLYQQSRTITDKEITFNILVDDFTLIKTKDNFIRKDDEPEVFNLINSLGYCDSDIKKCYYLDYKGNSLKYFRRRILK